jgi:transcriptional regulator GlxA family with amidase domain
MRFVFFLAPRFSMIAFAAAIEPLRLANRLTRRTLFDWRLAAEDGAPAHCSNGAAVTPDMALEDVPRDTVILVCGGLDAHLAASRPVLTWLRKQARRGAKFGAVCTGPGFSPRRASWRAVAAPSTGRTARPSPRSSRTSTCPIASTNWTANC